jgi:hypothetical protein
MTALMPMWASRGIFIRGEIRLLAIEIRHKSDDARNTSGATRVDEFDSNSEVGFVRTSLFRPYTAAVDDTNRYQIMGQARYEKA